MDDQHLRCREAVTRCYSGLCDCGQPECYALQAAVTVYRFHNPGCNPLAAETIVSHWVAGAVRH
ncbi:hypothetical protein HL658_22180 [Azospirillum sp. RWY-5-1]|uniref:Uncharacterized protein n=1 Tax=Azospirillum oleiclasticum TaxID=2735135 RepID=A0ABX2TDP0_9PROT|nr:hypothetical protein [Azospirillum oleiclasticum]NYZ15257.1 hypothetical protein [Azospirillum oleiclasticum]NYZ21322.1 hypothetical protein [Azospirillum oleiclasticum]